MSQEKVDRYKQQKVNRTKEMKREKMKVNLEKAVIGAIGILLCVWIGFSIYDKVHVEPVENYEVNLDALVDYQNSLSVD